MLECINKECRRYKSGVCNKKCDHRIKPTHIPNYAEEQLEYAKENKTNLMEQVKNGVNYEEGYFKLLKENANLNQLIEKKDIKIEKLEKEIDSLKEVINEENEQLTNEYSNKIIIAEQEINRLNTEVACLKAFKEKDNKQIQNLKDAVKKLAEIL